MKWRAFYADGRRISSADMSWKDLPATDLVIAVWWDGTNRHLDCGMDALLHTGTAIIGVNLPSSPFELAAKLEAAAGRLKYGVYMEPTAWAQIRDEADNARTPPER